jgi:hypothetical protein
MRITLITWMVWVPMASFAQTPPTIQWQHTYGGSHVEIGRFITATNDGGYITCNSTSSNDGDVTGFQGGSDVWVIKLDADGTMEWERCYGGSNVESDWWMVLEAPGGGYLIAGGTNSSDGDVSCPASGYRMWLARIGPGGELLWDLCPAGPEISGAAAITHAHDGGWMVCGGSWTQAGAGCGQGNNDLWMGHVSDAGELLWSRCHGGSLSDAGRSINPTSDGGYIVSGVTRSNDGDLTGINPYWTPPSPTTTGWVMKISGTGEILWQHCYGGSAHDQLYKASEAADGSYWIAGTTPSNDGDVSGNHGGDDVWVLRLDASGELLAQRCLGGGGSEGTPDLSLLSNGHALVAVNTNSTDGDITDPKGLHDGWVVELDPDLNIVWQHSYGGTNHDVWRGLHRSEDGGVVLTGYTMSTDGDLFGLTNQGSADVWVMKLAPWSGTGVEDQADENGILLFPNPTTGDLQLQWSGLHGDGWQLEIMDALGRVVHTMPQVHATRGRLTIGTHGLAQGSYAVRLHRNGESHVKRFIKQ